ncbi:hypothetical protein [Kaarinaea lacus]
MAHQVVKPGSTLKLNQELAIPPNKAGVRLQYGKITRYKEIDWWYPNCRFEVNKPLPTEQIIQPEEFVITRVSTMNQLVSSDHIQLAAVGIGIGIGMSDGGGGPMGEEMTTIFHLQSQSQPKVKQLICQHYQKVSDSRYLMLDEVGQALGSFFDFQLKP